MRDGSQGRLRDSLRPSGPVQFAVDQYKQPDETVLAVRGELDLMTAPRFGAMIGECVRSGHGNVLVDLTQLSFIDSTGLHVLLNAQRRLTRQSRRLKVKCSPGTVRRAFELSRLAETFGLDPDGAEPDDPN